MKCVAILLALAVCVAATTESSSSSFSSSSGSSSHDLPPCSACNKKGPLEKSEQIELQEHNMGLAKRLAPDAFAQVRKFLLGLEDKSATFVKLHNAIRGGHSVRFDFVQGDQHAVQSHAFGSTVNVKGDSLEVPEDENGGWHPPSESAKAASKAASDRWAKARADPDVQVHLPEKVNHFVSQHEADQLVSSNKNVAQRLAPDATPKVLKFLDAVTGAHNIIRLHHAINGGHIVDYELMNGDRAEIKSLGAKNGLTIDDYAITTAGAVSNGHAKDEAQGFDAVVPAEESAAACPPPGCPKEGDVIIVPAPGRKHTRSAHPNTMVLDVVQEVKTK